MLCTQSRIQRVSFGKWSRELVEFTDQLFDSSWRLAVLLFAKRRNKPNKSCALCNELCQLQSVCQLGVEQHRSAANSKQLRTKCIINEAFLERAKALLLRLWICNCIICMKPTIRACAWANLESWEEKLLIKSKHVWFKREHACIDWLQQSSWEEYLEEEDKGIDERCN